MKLLITGTAGFIGFHVARQALSRGMEVIGIDNLDSYYDVGLKRDRLKSLEPVPGFEFQAINICDRYATAKIVEQHRPERVVHLAAQVGVRYSVANPHAYVENNLSGFMNVLHACQQGGVKHFVYASSSSVYGANCKVPFSVEDNVNHPVSMYAATKKANELMAHVYSDLHDFPTTGLRFFTVYGPWGRPDMAPSLFTRAILENRAIDVYNNGDMMRDFTYIDDIVEGIMRVLDRPASSVTYKIYNIGNNRPVQLLHFIRVLARCLGKTPTLNMMPMQPGDVPTTFADIDAIAHDVGYRPTTSIEEGLPKFISWYTSYYHAGPSEDKV